MGGRPARFDRTEKEEEKYQANKKWQAENPISIKNARDKWNKNNKDKKNAGQREWTKKNPDWIKNWKKENIEQVRFKKNIWQKGKILSDPSFRLTKNMRTALSSSLKGRSKSKSTLEIIGTTLEELWTHLKSCKSWEPWMTEENYGKNGWDVDHIIPIKLWDFNCPLQFALCWDKSNLQPMEHIENIKKGSKIL